MNRRAHTLTVFDDGSGPALYAGGLFSLAGGVVANQIAKWDGTSWSALGNGVSNNFCYNAVQALAVFDDGSGPAIYAGGSYTTVGGVAANRLAKWDGSSWTALGSGIGDSNCCCPVHALAVFDDGGGPALYAGGDFMQAGGTPANHIARWGCPDSVPPVLSCPPPISVPDRLFDGHEVVYFTVTATDGVDPAPVVVCVPPSGSTFPLGTTLVTCTATDAQGNASSCEFPVTVTLKVRRR